MELLPPNKPPAKSPPPPSAPDNVTHRLKELLKTKQHPEEMHAHEEHEEEIHIDERWLIAYADKMTILCGFFIMLFAMSTLDPVKLQKVTESAEKSFGKPNADTPPKIEYNPEEVEKKLKEEITQAVQLQKVTEKKVETLTEQLKESETKREQIEQALKAAQAANTSQTELQALTTTLQTQVQTLQNKIQELQANNQSLEKTIEEMNSKQPDKPKDLTKPLKKENEALKKQVVTLQEQVTQKKTEITELKQELQTVRASLMSSGYLGFVMSWATREHDVDLIVEDPNHKVFDFKRREYKSHPGLLVLDTRQGPGVEVWQSDKVIPGTYTFTYSFYNAYGNNAPCKLTGTLFTSKGKIKIPDVTLDIQGNRSAVFKVSVDDEGRAKLVH